MKDLDFKTIIIKCSINTYMYTIFTSYFNPTMADEFFIKATISIDKEYYITLLSLAYGIDITNCDSDIWIEDVDYNIFNFELDAISRSMLISLIEDEYREESTLICTF